jgi:DNA-binding response OmpR family regulator
MFPAMAKILVVDDEPAIVELAQLYLHKDGYETVTAGDGIEALVQVKQARPDLVVLDLMLPGLDGWEVCRRLRSETDLPIIMLTARSEDVDKIVGLELGADDYITKPFNPRELVARVKAVLRRAQSRGEVTSAVIRMGDLTIDEPRREAMIGETPISLRTREFDLLLMLARHPGLVLSREQLLEQVWGYDYAGGTRTVDVHVSGLRQKLAGSGVRIETVWGIGYKLVVDEDG